MSMEEDIKSGVITDSMTFQQRVWAMTARIPHGKVSTYAKLADMLGTRAYRAVGSALGKNPYAPQVPCHRVVGSDGKLTGFFHGLDAKESLLKAEGIAVVDGRVDLQVFGMKPEV